MSIQQVSVSREEVNSLGKRVCLTDRDDEVGLENICYIDCKEDDSPLLKQCRGQVWRGNELILKSFPWTLEMTQFQKEKIEEWYDGTERIFKSYEGAIIRLFWFGERWWVTTNRKLNAMKNRWTSKETFGETFVKALSKHLGVVDSEKALETLTTSLDKTNKYIFLVRHNKENRIVCDSPSDDEPLLYHVATYIGGKVNFDVEIPSIPHPEEVKFNTVDELISTVNCVDIKQIQGYILFKKDSDEHCKIYKHDYMDLFDVRGNEMSIKYRYLQLRTDPIKTNLLYYLYPEYVSEFERYENILYFSAQYILGAYINRFIKKEFTTVPQDEYIIMQKVHNNYMQTRQKVNLENVFDVMNECPPTLLNKIIRRYNFEKRNQEKDV